MEFKDLIWNNFDPAQAHCLSWWDNRRLAERSKEARVKFNNGYSCRVLIGKFWKSNGIDNYEVQVYRGNSRYTEEPMIPEYSGYLEKSQVTEILKYVETLRPCRRKRKKNKTPIHIEQDDLDIVTPGWIKTEMDRYGIGFRQVHIRTGISKGRIRKIITEQNENYLGDSEKIALFELFRYLEETSSG